KEKREILIKARPISLTKIYYAPYNKNNKTDQNIKYKQQKLDTDNIDAPTDRTQDIDVQELHPLSTKYSFLRRFLIDHMIRLFINQST
ncbi:5813_t:CDS:1, partial [Rhizophagus irregularis]